MMIDTPTSRDSNAIAIHERKYNDSISSASVYSEIAFGDKMGFQEMSDLKEQKILAKGALYLFVPVCLFGLLAMYFPSVYIMFPAQESEMCVCSFF